MTTKSLVEIFFLLQAGVRYYMTRALSHSASRDSLQRIQELAEQALPLLVAGEKATMDLDALEAFIKDGQPVGLWHEHTACMVAVKALVAELRKGL